MFLEDIQKTTKIAHRISILYVEDDPSIQKEVLIFFQKIGLKVDTANDGLVALNKALKEQYTLVITDISLPSMNAIEMIALVKKQKPSQKFLITSALVNPQTLQKLHSLQVDGIMKKPFSLASLLSEIVRLH